MTGSALAVPVLLALVVVIVVVVRLALLGHDDLLRLVVDVDLLELVADEEPDLDLELSVLAELDVRAVSLSLELLLGDRDRLRERNLERGQGLHERGHVLLPRLGGGLAIHRLLEAGDAAGLGLLAGVLARPGAGERHDAHHGSERDARLHEGLHDGSPRVHSGRELRPARSARSPSDPRHPVLPRERAAKQFSLEIRIGSFLPERAPVTRRARILMVGVAAEDSPVRPPTIPPSQLRTNDAHAHGLGNRTLAPRSGPPGERLSRRLGTAERGPGAGRGSRHPGPPRRGDDEYLLRAVPPRHLRRAPAEHPWPRVLRRRGPAGDARIPARGLRALPHSAAGLRDGDRHDADAALDGPRGGEHVHVVPLERGLRLRPLPGRTRVRAGLRSARRKRRGL